MNRHASFVLGLGGTTRSPSSTEIVLRAALKEVERQGGRVEMLAGPDLDLPLYAPGRAKRDSRATRLVSLLRQCDGVVIASPGYHGTVSGTIKNALDYAEDLAGDPAPYLEGKPVGLITCAYGWQAAGSTLVTLRTIAHALRGWPTPLGVAVNSQKPVTDINEDGIGPALAQNLQIMARQLLRFTQVERHARQSAEG